MPSWSTGAITGEASRTRPRRIPRFTIGDVDQEPSDMASFWRSAGGRTGTVIAGVGERGQSSSNAGTGIVGTALVKGPGACADIQVWKVRGTASPRGVVRWTLVLSTRVISDIGNARRGRARAGRLTGPADLLVPALPADRSSCQHGLSVLSSDDVRSCGRTGRWRRAIAGRGPGRDLPLPGPKGSPGAPRGHRQPARRSGRGATRDTERRPTPR